MKFLIFIFYILVCLSNIYSQNLQSVDSLISNISKNAHDTAKINTYLEAGYLAESFDLNKSLELYDEALNISKKKLVGYLKKDSLQQLQFLKNKDNKRYLLFYEISMRYKGIVQYLLGKYSDALESYQKSLVVSEQINNQVEISKCLNNIAMILYQQSDYDNSLIYMDKSLKINETLKDTIGILYSLNSIGNIYTLKKNYNTALEYYYKLLELSKLINNRSKISTSYANLGVVYRKLNDNHKALSFYLKAVDIDLQLNDLSAVSVNYNNIANLYLDIKNYEQSISYSLKSIEIAHKIGLAENLLYAYGVMSESYAKLHNFEKAYFYYNLYSTVKDSMYNEQSNRLIREMETKYQTEKKQQEIVMLNKDKVLQKTEIARQEAEVKQQITQKYAFIAGFILTLILTLVAYNNLKQKKKANKLLALQNAEIKQQKEEITAQRDEIESQRDLVITQKEHIEDIHKEVTDSINYAKNIQAAILPDIDLIQMLLNDYFILFKPKNIVSGDFYWITIRKNWILVAVADCTGHGVPGAFMSMLGISFLNEIVAREDVQTASHVLNLLRKNVIKSMKQKGIMGEQKDGMDLAFVALNIETSELQFSGANNPLYIVSSLTFDVSSFSALENNSVTQSSGMLNELEVRVTEEDELANLKLERSENPDLSGQQTSNFKLFEQKPDKMPIAIHIRMDDFTNHQIQLNSGDIVYLFSDGYADQFGGSKGKKFLYKQFKELLLSNCNKPLSEQKEILEAKIEDWKNGYEIKYEQTDDITVVGIKI